MPSVYGRARGGGLTVDWTRPVSRRRFLWGAGLLGSGVTLASAFGCRSGADSPLTTLDRTIVLGMEGVLRPGPRVRDVPPDANRRLLTRTDWAKEMFNSSERPGPQGHGLTQGNVDKGIAYYVFEHGPLAFIVLDTVSTAGFAAGRVDAAQF